MKVQSFNQKTVPIGAVLMFKSNISTHALEVKGAWANSLAGALDCKPPCPVPCESAAPKEFIGVVIEQELALKLLDNKDRNLPRDDVITVLTRFPTYDHRLYLKFYKSKEAN